MKIGHVHLKVRNLEKAVDFYQRYLGLQVTEKIGGAFAFLSSGPMHHEIALQDVGANASLPQRNEVGLYHVAFEVQHRAAFAETWRRLAAGGIEVYPVDHRISWALYFSDPDGNGLEVYWDTRDTEHGAREWKGLDRPLTAAQINEEH